MAVTYCSGCGKKLTGAFCGNCGTKSSDSPQPASMEEKKEEQIKCPDCGSTQLSANKKGFGLGKAAVGGLLTGGIGLLGGFLGSGKVKITCLNCGKSWKAGKK